MNSPQQYTQLVHLSYHVVGGLTDYFPRFLAHAIRLVGGAWIFDGIKIAPGNTCDKSKFAEKIIIYVSQDQDIH